MSSRNSIAKTWYNVQYNLFPLLEQAIGKLTPAHKKLAAILELVRIEDFIPRSKFVDGRPPKDLVAIARANIAKIVFNIPYTKHLIRYLDNDKQLQQICGFNRYERIPSESTFSRAFKKFAKMSLPEKVHQALINEVYKDDLLLHVAIDSTAIIAREKPLKKGSKKERKRKREREQKWAKSHGELNRRERHLIENPEKSINELPKLCDKGMKKSSLGYTEIWKGYKLHVAINDDCVPLAAIVTSASLNDCEASIPLMKKTQHIKNLYYLMDAAYDHLEIKEQAISTGRRAIIDPCPHGPAQKEEKEAEAERKRILNFQTAEDKRYKERLPKERFNATYKDFHGGRGIFFKGHEKVTCHIMFGLLTITGSFLLSLIT